MSTVLPLLQLQALAERSKAAAIADARVEDQQKAVAGWGGAGHIEENPKGEGSEWLSQAMVGTARRGDFIMAFGAPKGEPP